MKLQQQNRNWGGKKTKQNRKTGKDGMPYTQCNTRAAHICEREFRFVGQPLGAHRGCKALFGNNERRARRGKKAEALGALQKPLEEGDAVRFFAGLKCLFSGLGLTVAHITVAQQHVQQLTHLPLPLSKPLDYRWELKGHIDHTVISRHLSCIEKTS